MSGPNTDYDPVQVSALEEEHVAAARDAALAAITAAADLAALKQVRLEHAGDRSPLALANREIGALPPQARKEAGQRVGRARGEVTQALAARTEVLEAEHEERMLVEEAVDVTLPVDRAPRGSRHPLTTGAELIEDIFVAMGWEVAEGPVVEAEWLNFDALNLGADHPARTMQDTFWTEPADHHLVLRTHTSPVQARTMLTRTPPIYVVCPGRVFRTDEYDATHSPMFHQVEGLVVDEGITMAHLKGTLDHFAVADVRRGDRDPVPAVVLPLHRAVRRGRPALLRLPRCRLRRVPHLPGRGLDRVGRLRRGQPPRADRLRRRQRALHRVRLRHGHRPDPDVPHRCGRPARLLRGRRPLLVLLRNGDLTVRAPVSWIRDHVDLPDDLDVEKLADAMTDLGLKVEAIERPGHDITGPLVVGRVLTMEPEPQKNGKTINWCTVDVGASNATGEPQGIVCGAHNFAPGDLVVVVLPGGVLPGGFEISARKTYGHVSAGMICSASELGLGDDTLHDGEGGIVVLPADSGEPGDDAFDLLHLRDEVLEFEINPDRAYALSLRGVAREAALGTAVHGGGSTFRDPADREPPRSDELAHPVEVEDPVGCPVFSGRSVTGFDPAAPTPPWLARRVQLAGMRPISLAVDVTNYVMLELGQPIHGFDRSRLAGPIRVRRAREGERLRTLDGVDRALVAGPEGDLLITDDSGPIGLAGVMGGETTELSETTTDIFIEAAHWDPVSIFRTARRHKLPSEAAKRFERGTDPTITLQAADRVAELLTTYGGGTVEPGVTHVGAPPEPTRITIPVDLPARITGMGIDEDTVAGNLAAVGCEVVVSEGELTATVPPWRPDLTDPYDLVEEVARLVGYENVPSVLPTAPSGRGLTRRQKLRRRVGRTLAGAGFVEVVSFPFVGEQDLDALGLPAGDERRTTLRLANPLSTERPSMTTTLLPGLLGAASRNVGRGTSDLALFELGSVTLPHAGQGTEILPVDRRPTEGELDDLVKGLPDQPLHLGVVASGRRLPSGWWGAGRPVEWSDAVAAVREVADALGVRLEVRSGSRTPWHPGRCAEIVADGAVVGWAGELHPRVCTAWGVPARSVAAEVDLGRLLDLAPDDTVAPSLSHYPVAKEDVALVVDAAVTVAEVEAALREGAGDLLESVRLFDVYTGDQVGEGRKSLAFALRFRAPDRTLTEGEAGAARDAAVALAADRCGAVQRS